jgi:hypothetical protein
MEREGNEIEGILKEENVKRKERENILIIRDG